VSPLPPSSCGRDPFQWQVAGVEKRTVPWAPLQRVPCSAVERGCPPELPGSAKPRRSIPSRSTRA
jgi:hypothetical protein